MISEYLGMAWRNLKRRRLRSWLTILGIVISIAIIFVLISLSLGLSSAIEEQFRLLGSDKFFVGPKDSFGGGASSGAVLITEDDVKEIEGVSGVRATSSWTIATGRLEANKRIRFNTIIGVDPAKLDVFVEAGFINIEEGRMISVGDDKKIVIGSQYKYNNYLVEPIELGKKILINDEDFRVVGILKSVGSPPDDQIIYMPLDRFRQTFPDTGERIDQIAVQIEAGRDIVEVANNVEKKLRNFRDVDEKNQDFTILTPEDLLATLGTVLNIITGFLLGVAGISLLVGSIGIANTMYTSVIERTKEIGVMKAVGARNEDVLRLFTYEAGFIGLLGGVFGVLIGFAFVKGIEYLAAAEGFGFLQAATPPYLILGCLVFSFVIGAISGRLPAKQAANVIPVEALRYE